MEYLRAEEPEGCIFCLKPAEECDRDNGIVWRGRTCFIILNAFPYNPGHLMVVPYKHVSSLVDLDGGELSDLMATCRLAVKALDGCMSPAGYNIGINQGRAAGAGIDSHVHQHVVPRWAGDTNFMTTVGATKVLPELVGETYDRLLPFFRDGTE